jgi:hypothetical protein
MGAIARIGSHLLALTRRLITVAACADCCESPWGGPPPGDPDVPPPTWPPPSDPSVAVCNAPCFEDTFGFKPQPCTDPTNEICLECCCPCAMTYRYVGRIYQYESSGYDGKDLIWSETEVTHHVEIECACVGGNRSCTWKRKITEIERRWNLPEPIVRTTYEEGPLPSFVSVLNCWPNYEVTGCVACNTPGWTITATEMRTCRSRRYSCYADTGETEPGVRRIRALDVWSVLTPLDSCAGTISTGPCPSFHGMGAGDFLGDDGGDSGGGEA